MQTDEYIAEVITELCADASGRPTGSRANQQAVWYVHRKLQDLGYQAELHRFPCMDWQDLGSILEAGGHPIPAVTNPYSPAGSAAGRVMHASTISELRNLRSSNALIAVSGELTLEPLMPKNFPFYNPEHHKEIIYLLEALEPQAVIAVTAAEKVTPICEDGDLAFPSVTVHADHAAALVGEAPVWAELAVRTRTASSEGANCIAVKDRGSKQRIVICAHIDSHRQTPGALDNAAGTAVVLASAAMLREYRGPYSLEFVFFNGEDYYSNPGEQLYITLNSNRFSSIALAVNIDGAGFRSGRTACTSYQCSEQVSAGFSELILNDPAFIIGEPWYESDHSLFIQQGCPAVAVTSEKLEEVTAVTHTPSDTTDQLDYSVLSQAARMVVLMVEKLHTLI